MVGGRRVVAGKVSSPARSLRACTSSGCPSAASKPIRWPPLYSGKNWAGGGPCSTTGARPPAGAAAPAAARGKLSRPLKGGLVVCTRKLIAGQVQRKLLGGQLLRSRRGGLENRLRCGRSKQAVAPPCRTTHDSLRRAGLMARRRLLTATAPCSRLPARLPLLTPHRSPPPARSSPAHQSSHPAPGLRLTAHRPVPTAAHRPPLTSPCP